MVYTVCHSTRGILKNLKFRLKKKYGLKCNFRAFTVFLRLAPWQEISIRTHNICLHGAQDYVVCRARENRKNSRSGPKLRILDRFQTPQNANKSVQHFPNQPILTNQ